MTPDGPQGLHRAAESLLGSPLRKGLPHTVRQLMGTDTLKLIGITLAATNIVVLVGGLWLIKRRQRRARRKPSHFDGQH